MASRKTRKSHLPKRLNVLFFAVFILFSALILRLGFIQIVQGDSFEQDLEEASEPVTRIDAPRGVMYDRNGEIAVDNQLILSLTYTNSSSVSDEERLDIAERLSGYMEMDTDSITDRDLRDYWLITREEEAEALLSEEEMAAAGENGEDPYDLQLEKITEEQLSDIQGTELETVAVWREMISGYNDSPQRVKENLTREEAHEVSVRLEELPGVDLLRDSNRQYVFDESFPGFFGSVGSIPRETIDEYLALGYDRSDLVGTSFLEEEYESALRGVKGELLDAEEALGNGAETTGRRGNDLVLSVDMALQQDLETIVDEQVGGQSGNFVNEEDAYAVMIEPSTGEVLAASGYQDQVGTVSSSFEMGSTVKMATVLAGLQEGVVTADTYINDTPIDLPGTPSISSASNSIGSVNYLGALERSSNIYMSEIAMRLADYERGSTFNTANVQEAYDTMRYYYNQFGLGTETGIDLPSESSGISGGYGDPGNLLYLSFGQFDTYTPMQLAQYVSTIANDGYRVEPHFVKEVRHSNPDKSNMGSISQQIEPSIMNKIDIDDEYIDMAQEGMLEVVEGSNGTARSYFSDAPYEIAGKTGTAQVTVRNEGTGELDSNAANQAFVGYAPYDNPEVAIAVIVPYTYLEENGGRNGVANTIAREAMDAYFELKEERPEIDPENEDVIEQQEAEEGTEAETEEDTGDAETEQ
ncbi:penicillin-binding protein 2 [Sinobaca sp. H24]|uniref:peptidoglycan D,D-transpeptidase FtsI family protein n=1 Tax=Sinobaca sp. H24 TaxID=2923376 RepID=UPI00207A877A|nr:penicillin-binding transpeptidase domain-containing protein [Sinobaca sp. H24]